MSDNELLERVGELHRQLKARGSRSPGVIALNLYCSWHNKAASFMARWAYALKTSGLGAEDLSSALQQAQFPEAV